ncbi:GDSL-type esterase/lipase family protein [Chitinophaga varians]|uniref:GDSL-type esterase/lipase family protein n=1 Tax=Chitinophaga varians TaxID=2202339 RepID=UPI00165F8C3D|nr:GDSL-type esterase/lipase family protein [Chitinophaga varians]MBC9909598.1 GDSL family lipase [Chitinophaga varians]
MTKLFFPFLLGALLSGNSLLAQEQVRYQEDVRTIKKFDQMYAPPANPILFVGSSSIRKWDDLERTFADYVVMNRGVGGAVTNDIIYFAPDLIFDYHPRQVVIYVGENDLPEGATADSVFSRFQRLYSVVRSRLPEVPIEYISLKPSPSRVKYMKTAAEANSMIKAFLAKEKNAHFIDVFPLMLDKQGQPRPELFVSDMLHMNAQGYAIWSKAIKPYLLKKSSK